MDKDEVQGEVDELSKKLSEFHNKLKSEQIDLDPEIQKMVDDNFWDLLIKT